jgi:hypothetical protein
MLTQQQIGPGKANSPFQAIIALGTRPNSLASLRAKAATQSRNFFLLQQRTQGTYSSLTKSDPTRKNIFFFARTNPGIDAPLTNPARPHDPQ